MYGNDRSRMNYVCKTWLLEYMTITLYVPSGKRKLARLQNQQLRSIGDCDCLYRQILHKFEVFQLHGSRSLIFPNSLASLDADAENFSIVLCSDLEYFKFNRLVFISDFVKFMFCHNTSSIVFNVGTNFDIKSIFYNFLCLDAKNLSYTSDKTKGTLNDRKSFSTNSITKIKHTLFP